MIQNGSILYNIKDFIWQKDYKTGFLRGNTKKQDKKKESMLDTQKQEKQAKSILWDKK